MAGLRSDDEDMDIEDLEDDFDDEFEDDPESRFGFLLGARDNDLEETPAPYDPRHATVVNHQEHVGRNDPCPCGSGKKFKKCCGAPGSRAATSS